MKRSDATQIAVYALLGILLVGGLFFLWKTQNSLNNQSQKKVDAIPPAELTLTLLSPSDCEKCIDGNEIVQLIEKQNVRLKKTNSYVTDSDEGKALIEKYSLQRAPALVIEGDYNNPVIKDALVSYGGKEKEGALVIEVSQPVYMDLAQDNSIVGLVDITYLTDKTCEDCYDALRHKGILTKNFGVIFQSETSLDAQSSDGRALIKKYDIKELPTILLSPEAIAYKRLAGVWPKVGTIESDGNFVFRDDAALGQVVYRDLVKGIIIRPTSTEALPSGSSSSSVSSTNK